MTMIDLYNNKLRVKLVLIILAMIIGIVSLWYTNNLANKLSEREQKLIDLYAKGLQQIANPDNNSNITFLFQEIIEANSSIPVILTDDAKNPVSHKNIVFPPGMTESRQTAFLKEKIEVMKQEHEPIVVDYRDLGFRNYIYYENSSLLSQLNFYPYIQLSAISILFLLGFMAFSFSKRSEQNKLWVGLSKETAHQLGTPLSGLMAWIEILKSDERLENDDLILEMEKDVMRLAMITERFSNIGSLPSLKNQQVEPCLQNIIDYLSKRTSSKVVITFTNHLPSSVSASLNRPLFEWVIENICKNAIDAMSGEGSIFIDMSSNEKGVIQIDVRDTGKGMAKKDFTKVFVPGFTTKQRGWGLGLTLVKRIVEEYHKGKIYVKSSEIGKGTTFRILLYTQKT